MSKQDEATLQAAAQAVVDEQVLAAGIFGWQDVVAAGVGGSTAGALAGGGAGHVVGSGLGAGVGAGIGGFVAEEAMAKEQGMTLRLLVAVTPTSIRVLDWAHGAPGDEVRRFERETTQVQVTKLGLSRIVHLHDTTSGEEVSLHASTNPISAGGKTSKVVLHLLDAA
jgi:outer membrane lipoprotein SlyB